MEVVRYGAGGMPIVSKEEKKVEPVEKVEKTKKKSEPLQEILEVNPNEDDDIISIGSGCSPTSLSG